MAFPISDIYTLMPEKCSFGLMPLIYTVLARKAVTKKPKEKKPESVKNITDQMKSLR